MFKLTHLVVPAVMFVALPAWGAQLDDPAEVPKDDPALLVAKDAVRDGRYERAISLLQKFVVRNDNNASAWNYLGFSRRKLGQFDNALADYKKALAINPDHKGANEYLGELYVELGRLDLARERLSKLGAICNVSCEEYLDLQAAIRAKGG